MTFKAWADEHFGGIRWAFAVFNADGSNSVTLREWRHACRIYGFNQGSSSLFKPLTSRAVHILLQAIYIYIRTISFISIISITSDVM